MKRNSLRFILFVIAAMIILLLQGRTKDIDSTFQEAIESFNQYELVVNEFIDYPTEEKIANVTIYESEFSTHYYDLIYHQTFYNKLLRVQPILTEKEVLQLEDVHRNYQKLDSEYVSTALTNVFQADDFSRLIDEAKTKGEYISDHIDIRYLGDNHFNMVIRGTMYLEGSSNILNGYFMIETEGSNYYWEKPDNFSIAYSNKEISINVDEIHYDIQGKFVY